MRTMIVSATIAQAHGSPIAPCEAEPVEDAAGSRFSSG